MEITRKEDLEEMEDFKLVVDILKEPSNEVFVSLNPPFYISFEINADILDKNLSEKDMDKELFFSISRIAGFLLLQLLQSNDEDEIVENLTDNLKDESERDKEKIQLREQLKIVKSDLLTENISDRYTLKISSKAPSFSSVDWDIKLKINDSKIKEIHVPYATCKFEYQREFKFPLYYPSGNRFFDSMQINFSLDEVKYLKRIFADIEKKLELAEKLTIEKTN